MEKRLTDTQIDICRHDFKMMDLDNDGLIDIKDLRGLLKKVGRHATGKEVMSMLQKVGARGKRKINFRTFLRIVTETMNLPPQLNEKLEDALKVFDRESDGRVLASELYYALTKMGTRLTTKEATYFLNQLSVDINGKVKISDVVKLIGEK